MSKHTRGNDMSNDKTDKNAAKAAATANIEPGAPIPLNQIHVDYGWNCRGERRVQDISDAESSGFEGFGQNIRETGQITPVILRHTHGKTILGAKTDLPYELVVGFRRMRAVRLLNEDKNEVEKAKAEERNNVPNLPNGTILATVREVNDPIQARLLNGQENTLRSNLKAPDLVFLVKELADTKMIQTAIGQSLGITQSWVSKLLKIASLPPAIVSHWRSGTAVPAVTTKDGIFSLQANEGTELTEPDMRALAELKSGPEEITARYIRMVKPPVTQGDGSGAPNTEVDKVMQNVKEIAALMGCMVRAGVLENGSLDWNRVIGLKKKGYPIDCGKDDSQQRLIDLGDAAQEAFEQEVTRGARGVENASTAQPSN